jgi:UDP-2,3-diacylglucosamine hydrolase
VALPDDASPSFGELRAPASWQVVDFISDLHLCDDTPRGFDAWSRYMHNTPADAVIILGDLFEVWVGDDAREAGFEARCAEVLRTTAAARGVAFMAGNRDFLVGQAMLSACGVQALQDPTVLVIAGARLLLSHGDALCIDDVEYQQFRVQVRSASWQREFLALPLPERRQRARQMRDQSRQRNAGRAMPQWSDVVAPTAVALMRAADSPVLIHGHTHRPATETLAPGFIRHVLSDWELDHAPAARAEVLRWQGADLTRLPLSSAVRP